MSAGVGVFGDVVVVGIVTTGEIEDVLSPPQAVRIAHRVKATKRLGGTKNLLQLEIDNPFYYQRGYAALD